MGCRGYLFSRSSRALCHQCAFFWPLRGPWSRRWWSGWHNQTVWRAGCCRWTSRSSGAPGHILGRSRHIYSVCRWAQQRSFHLSYHQLSQIHWCNLCIYCYDDWLIVITMLLHHSKELDNNLGDGPEKHLSYQNINNCLLYYPYLSLSSLLSINNRS